MDGSDVLSSPIEWWVSHQKISGPNCSMSSNTMLFLSAWLHILTVFLEILTVNLGNQGLGRTSSNSWSQALAISNKIILLCKRSSERKFNVIRVFLRMAIWFHVVARYTCVLRNWRSVTKKLLPETVCEPCRLCKMPLCVCTYRITNGYLFIKIKGKWTYKLGRAGVTRLTLSVTGVTKVTFDKRTVRIPIPCEDVWKWYSEV